MKNVVITGAGSGLGASLAREYAKLGYHICLVGRTFEKLNKVKDLLKTNSSIFAVDVSRKEDVVYNFQKIKREVGSIDILINNAGVGIFDNAEKIDEKSVNKMIDTNLKGTIFCTQEVLYEMKKQNQGTIINIISTAGLEGKETEAVYCASKYGIRGFSESLLEELQSTKINIFNAYMGGMKTNFWDGIFSDKQVESLMDPKDIAEIIIQNTKKRNLLNVNDVVIKNSK